MEVIKNILDLDKAKFIGKTMYITNGEKWVINHVYRGNLLLGFECEVQKDNQLLNIFLDEEFPQFLEIKKMFEENEVNEKVKEFAVDCLVENGVYNESQVIEVQSNLTNCLSKRLLDRNSVMKAMLVNPHLNYELCKQNGFNNVIAGEVLKDNNGLWVVNRKLKDASGNEHHNPFWAREKVETVRYNNCSLLCLNGRKDIKKIVCQFNSAFVGYYGIIGSEDLEIKKDFYEREMESAEDFEEFEMSTRINHETKALVHMYIKRK